VFVANALSPAQVLSVDIDEEHRIANVTVPERMLSLAIGREGQNARLAARLTGWRIDIRSDVSAAEARPRDTAPAAAPETQATNGSGEHAVPVDSAAPAPVAETPVEMPAETPVEMPAETPADELVAAEAKPKRTRKTAAVDATTASEDALNGEEPVAAEAKPKRIRKTAAVDATTASEDAANGDATADGPEKEPAATASGKKGRKSSASDEEAQTAPEDTAITAEGVAS
jgi:hypothetical protein